MPLSKQSKNDEENFAMGNTKTELDSTIRMLNLLNNGKEGKKKPAANDRFNIQLDNSIETKILREKRACYMRQCERIQIILLNHCQSAYIETKTHNVMNAHYSGICRKKS